VIVIFGGGDLKGVKREAGGAKYPNTIEIQTAVFEIMAPPFFKRGRFSQFSRTTPHPQEM